MIRSILRRLVAADQANLRGSQGGAVSKLDSVIDRSAVPDTMANALTFMLAGAALAVVQGVVGALSELNRPAVAAASLVSGVIVAGIWWWVARVCQQGRAGGRVLGSVFFALSTLGIVQTLAGQFHVRPALAVVDVLSWLVGLGAIVMLWRRDSTAFFQSRRRYRA
jgi:hypothetical protein